MRITTFVFCLFLCATVHAGGKLKVYILAGQSNMVGCGRVDQFDYIGEDPKTAPMLKLMRGPDGKPTVCDKVWISDLAGGGKPYRNAEWTGKLTAGLGGWRTPGELGDMKNVGPVIGPEFTFGIYMQKLLDEPILIIKAAWGGKDLYCDFRPPSAGKPAYAIPNPKREIGLYYRLMMEHVKKVLADPKRVCPAYDPEAGYEVAGFVWFQGWNDGCAAGSEVYPGKKPTDFSEYSRLLACLIRDVRKELGAPEMRAVIGVMGVGGVNNTGQEPLRKAMAAPASLPEFKGSVVAVPTAPFWPEELERIFKKKKAAQKAAYYLRGGSEGGVKNVRKDPVAAELLKKYLTEGETKMTQEQIKAFMAEYLPKVVKPEEEALWKRAGFQPGYHYMGCAKTYALIGRAFAEAMLGKKD